ncbi:hypothetical protein ABZV80_31795 [Streptomyces sp. NPDC005132]|uniref:hypothetical protein n=1 Tax=Streptomyces sp. NPDC005132 TaxID=3154294 RepID=UPI0033B64656
MLSSFELAAVGHLLEMGEFVTLLGVRVSRHVLPQSSELGQEFGGVGIHVVEPVEHLLGVFLLLDRLK